FGPVGSHEDARWVELAKPDQTQGVRYSCRLFVARRSLENQAERRFQLMVVCRADECREIHAKRPLERVGDNSIIKHASPKRERGSVSFPCSRFGLAWYIPSLLTATVH